MSFMKDESYIGSDEIEVMPDEPGNDLQAVLELIQTQLTFLEKKVDMLLSRSREISTFENERPAPRPFRKPYAKSPQRFDRPPRRDRNDGDDREREYRGRESSRDSYPDRRRVGKKPGGRPSRPNPGKKPFYSRYE